MLHNKKIVVVLPAYNAAKTLEKTYNEIPFDNSPDDTIKVAERLGIKHIIKHQKNRGYGGNQKTCYAHALSLGADVIIMLHPDYQYTPMLIPAMASIIAQELYPVVLGSRILGKGALKGGMPMYKYIANRFLTLFQNILIGEKLSEYHTGYRAFSKEVIMTLHLEANSDDFVFDNQMLSQIVYAGFSIGEVTCPTKYFAEASSINFKRSSIYGFGVLWVSLKHFLQRIGIAQFDMYKRM